jgi:argininosuccinate lyase
LKLADFQEAHPQLDESIYEVLGVEQAVKRFGSYGSTAPLEVERQVTYWKDKLGLNSRADD